MRADYSPDELRRLASGRALEWRCASMSGEKTLTPTLSLEGRGGKKLGPLPGGSVLTPSPFEGEGWGEGLSAVG